METNRKVQVIMLPTEDKSSIIINTYINNTHSIKPLLSIQAGKQYLASIMSHDDTSSLIARGLQPQHLYFTTDDEIKEGDWCIDVDEFGGMILNIAYPKNIRPAHLQQLKIIATTDKLKVIVKKGKFFNKGKYLPQPSQAFIEKYCKEDGIDEVLVEYERIDTYPKTLNDTNWGKLIPKIDSHNTITIHPIKDSWSREEHIADLEAIYMLGINVEKNKEDYKTNFDGWIKDNL